MWPLIIDVEYRLSCAHPEICYSVEKKISFSPYVIQGFILLSLKVLFAEVMQLIREYVYLSKHPKNEILGDFLLTVTAFWFLQYATLFIYAY